MSKHKAFFIAILFLFSNCFADTFVNIKTGEKFNGFFVQKQKGSENLVRIEKSGPRYLNLKEYDIQRNSLGRKKQVHILSINNSLDITAEVEAFEKSITASADSGPLFILIRIDCPGGRKELAQRISQAILDVDNCDVIALIEAGEYGGAYAESVPIALACNRIYMLKRADIGSKEFSKTQVDLEAVARGYDRQRQDEQAALEWLQYNLELAGKGKRPPLFIKAMFDETIHLVTVKQEDKVSLIEMSKKTSEQTVLNVRSRNGELLRFTASEALQYGVVDELVETQKQFLAQLAPEGAAKILDRRMPAARRAFANIQNRMNQRMTRIRNLEQRAAQAFEELDEIERQLYTPGYPLLLQRRGYRSESYRDDWMEPDTGIYDEGSLTIRREDLLRELSAVLLDVIDEYRQVIRLAENNPDLMQDPADLTRAMESAQSRYRIVRLRLRARR